jgi:hypothetical protein
MTPGSQHDVTIVGTTNALKKTSFYNDVFFVRKIKNPRDAVRECGITGV